MLRRLIRHPRAQAALAGLVGLYLGLVARTTRWTILGTEHLEAALGTGAAERRTAILAFWHERLVVMPPVLRAARRAIPALGAAPMHVLVSRHRDGRLIGAVGARFDMAMVHASSSRGGAAGLRALVRLLGEGANVAITPDGPRGPRRRAAPGVAQLAALAGRPVLPCSARPARCLVLNSWDRMLVPLPFGRGVITVMPPVAVGRREGGAEAALPAIEAALTEACERADALVAGGRRAIAAATAAASAGMPAMPAAAVRRTEPA